MKNIIIEYQKAFNDTMEKLNENENISAVFTFGSIISGDMWEESDIDFFVVHKDKFDDIRDIYSEVNGIPVHIKLISKEKFINSYENKDFYIIRIRQASFLIFKEFDFPALFLPRISLKTLLVCRH